MHIVAMQTFIVYVIVIAGFLVDMNVALNFFQKGVGAKSKSVTQLKSEILTLARRVQRGLSESPQERAEILSLFEQLERANKNKKTLSSPYLNAVWSLEYTTSDSILGRKGSPRIGPILQTIDAKQLRAENSEVVRYFNVFDVRRKVAAELTAVSPSQVAVRFKRFTLGLVGINENLISFDAPARFTGSLDTTYLDEDLRLSRGDKGNIFVLSRYADLP